MSNDELNWLADKLLPRSFHGPDNTFLSAGWRALPPSPNVIVRPPDDRTLSSMVNAKWEPRLYPGGEYAASDVGGPAPSLEPRLAYNPQNDTVIPMTNDDPMLKAAPNLVGSYPRQIGYPASYPQNMPPPRRVPAPYFASPTGPYMSPGWRPGGNPDLPYIDPHLPLSPGDPGWTPPTSTGTATGPLSMSLRDPSMTFTPGMTGLLGR